MANPAQTLRVATGAPVSAVLGPGLLNLFWCTVATLDIATSGLKPRHTNAVSPSRFKAYLPYTTEIQRYILKTRVTKRDPQLNRISAITGTQRNSLGPVAGLKGRQVPLWGAPTLCVPYLLFSRHSFWHTSSGTPFQASQRDPIQIHGVSAASATVSSGSLPSSRI